MNLSRITPCLWFDGQAEEAARHYTGIFPDARIVGMTRYTEVGYEFHGKPAGSVMTVVFQLAGQEFTALNGGPMFRFNEAISFQVRCDTQAEVDYYWERLSEGGDPAARACGWLKDRFGVSWQVVPAQLQEWLGDHEAAATRRVLEALFGMKKLDIEALRRAREGGAAS